jgi:hypothetical protein
LIPNPILKVLSTFQKHQIRALLIGGQAAILYGAAEFSRDSDFVLLVTRENLELLVGALDELQAERIVFPPLTLSALRKGHGVHLRCRAPGVEAQRVDLLGRLRGCQPFSKLWERRHLATLPDGGLLPVIGLRDLVQSKKTQRDKDWVMLRRLIENDIAKHGKHPTPDQVRWWLAEAREPISLISLAAELPKDAQRALIKRPLLRAAISGDGAQLAADLWQEEQLEKAEDRAYWDPLRKEVEACAFDDRDAPKRDPTNAAAKTLCC